MSLRQLVEGDCGGVNPLMQLGGQFTRDVAHKDEGGFARAQYGQVLQRDEQIVSEFLNQVAAPPQSFKMDTLLQEMREIEQINAPQAAPRIIDEVRSQQWSQDFAQFQAPIWNPQHMINVRPQQQQIRHVNEFFDEPAASASSLMSANRGYFQSMPVPQLAICPPYQIQPPGTTAALTNQFFDTVTSNKEMPKTQDESMEDWINDFQTSKETFDQTAHNYNEKFWQRLQDEWQKLSEESEHPWLSEFNENYEPYKKYQFAEENPMTDLENAFERGKEYLTKGDVPSAVLCFEVAAKKNAENAEIWEYLGLTQAENEMDPQSIAALKHSLALNPDNPRVLMALAVCYTNESLQSQAIKMLTKWLQVHPSYGHIVEKHSEMVDEGDNAASSIISGNRLLETQNLFLEAVRLNPQAVDPDVQEALGVLYNLSSEYDKAVDCFRAALHVNPVNAKIWNRLGASLANGSRSVEAVEAYQQALELEPGFIRVRYNVGVCCMNLKAYKQAVEHLLTALNMQAHSAALRELPAGSVGGGQQQMSESIWSTLKMVVSLMGRSDLQGHVADRNLSALNDAFKD